MQTTPQKICRLTAVTSEYLLILLQRCHRAAAGSLQNRRAEAVTGDLKFFGTENPES